MILLQHDPSCQHKLHIKIQISSLGCFSSIPVNSLYMSVNASSSLIVYCMCWRNQEMCSIREIMW